MKSMIQIPVAIEAAETFIRQMTLQGYEVTAETAPLDPSLHDYSFRLGGRTSIKYAVTIRYGSDPGDNRYAFVGIRPDSPTT